MLYFEALLERHPTKFGNYLTLLFDITH